MVGRDNFEQLGYSNNGRKPKNDEGMMKNRYSLDRHSRTFAPAERQMEYCSWKQGGVGGCLSRDNMQWRFKSCEEVQLKDKELPRKECWKKGAQRPG